MAKITEVRYSRLSTRRVDRFENERMEAAAIIDDGENPAVVVQWLKRFVDQQLGLGPTKEELNAARKLIRDWNHDPFA